MAFSCGCEVRPGEPIDYETIKKHFKHTMEAILFWELLFRKGQDLSEKRMSISEARMNLLKAIEELFPEASED